MRKRLAWFCVFIPALLLGCETMPSGVFDGLARANLVEKVQVADTVNATGPALQGAETIVIDSTSPVQVDAPVTADVPVSIDAPIAVAAPDDLDVQLRGALTDMSGWAAQFETKYRDMLNSHNSRYSDLEQVVNGLQAQLQDLIDVTQTATAATGDVGGDSYAITAAGGWLAPVLVVAIIGGCVVAVLVVRCRQATTVAKVTASAIKALPLQMQKEAKWNVRKTLALDEIPRGGFDAWLEKRGLYAGKSTNQ